MSKRTFIIFLGLLVVAWPFLGLPLKWQPIVLGVIGGLIILTETYSYLLDYWRQYLSQIDENELANTEATTPLQFSGSASKSKLKDDE